MAEIGQPLRINHIYTGEDGKSRLQEIEIPMESIGARGAVSQLLAGSGVIFRMMPPAMDADWHTAPRRQLIVNLIGEGELETGDGQILQIKPGVIEFLEDTTGQGHKTRVKGSGTRLCVFLPLDDDTKLA